MPFQLYLRVNEVGAVTGCPLTWKCRTAPKHVTLRQFRHVLHFNECVLVWSRWIEHVQSRSLLSVMSLQLQNSIFLWLVGIEVGLVLGLGVVFQSTVLNHVLQQFRVLCKYFLELLCDHLLLLNFNQVLNEALPLHFIFLLAFLCGITKYFTLRIVLFTEFLLIGLFFVLPLLHLLFEIACSEFLLFSYLLDFFVVRCCMHFGMKQLQCWICSEFLRGPVEMNSLVDFVECGAVIAI